MTVFNEGSGASDGVSLTSAAHPIEITPEMMAAGLAAAEAAWQPGKDWPDMVAAVYRAMAAATPVLPDDIDGVIDCDVELPPRGGVAQSSAAEAVLQAIITDCERTDPDDVLAQRKLISRVYGMACRMRG